MVSILWKTVLARVDTFVYDYPEHASSEYVIREAIAQGKDVGAYLNALDIRDAAKVRDLFPSVFPRGMKTVPLMADCNRNGRWFLTRSQS